MEKQANGIDIEQGKDVIVTSDIAKMSKEQFRLMADFIGRDDLHKSEDIIVLESLDNFNEAEVLVFFKDELFIRCKKKEETIVHNENLAMDCNFKFQWDSAISISRTEVSCISVLRPALCECSSCSSKREKGESPVQAKYYSVEVMTSSKEYSARIFDRENAFMLQDLIRQWRFQSGDFAVNKKRKKKISAK